MATDFTLVQIAADGLWAVRGSASPAGVAIENWAHAKPPAEVVADAALLGAWVGKTLDDERMPKGRVMLCVPRGDVVLKVLSLPPAVPGSDGVADLPPMVRLQMIRQLTLPAEGTAIDFVPLPSNGTPSRRVLAAALPADRLAWLRAVAQAAGLKVKHIALTSAGLAAAVAEIGQRRDGPVLALAAFGQHVEMVVVENGVMTLSRSIEVPGLGETPDPAAGERLEVECRRTWASHFGPAEGPPACVVCLGDGPGWEAIAERCGRTMETSGVAIASAEGVRPSKPFTGLEASWVLPLAGVLLSLGVERPMLDFANPRKAPDLSARTRQLVLAGVMVAIVLGIGLYIVADQKLGQLRKQLESVRQASGDLSDKVATYRVLHARVNGLEAWERASPDWMAHLASVGAKLPDPRVVQLSSLSGAAAGDATFSSSGAYPAGKWGDRVQVKFGLDGKMDDRSPIAELREALLGMGDYTVMSKGADVPASFSLELSTDRKRPAATTKVDESDQKNTPGSAAAKHSGKASGNKPKPGATPDAKPSDNAPSTGGAS
ncbi:MAG: hypothetical protein WC718_05345 [Phycisphaerales bacterium]|jgi:hypothetical protein